MRVAMYYGNRDVRLEEKPQPKIGADELLIKVEAAGICGSDCMEWYRRDKVPLVLGHEIAGVVEEVGGKVKNYKKGERVVCAHHVPCGRCHYCFAGHETVCETLRKTNFNPGGFVEFVKLSPIHVEKGIFVLPQEVSFEEATFVEPLACVLRGQRLAGGVEGKFILLIGSGIAGILHILYARYGRAAHIIATDVSEYRLNIAKKCGADEALEARTYSPDTLRKLNSGRMADLVIVSTGSIPAIQQALRSVERGGKILFFAPKDNNDNEITIPFNDLFWRTEISFISSYAGSPAEYKEALDLIASKKIKVSDLITHRLGLAETGLGFKLVAEAKESLKVIIYPQK